MKILPSWKDPWPPQIDWTSTQPARVFTDRSVMGRGKAQHGPVARIKALYACGYAVPPLSIPPPNREDAREWEDFVRGIWNA